MKLIFLPCWSEEGEEEYRNREAGLIIKKERAFCLFNNGMELSKAHDKHFVAGLKIKERNEWRE